MVGPSYGRIQSNHIVKHFAPAELFQLGNVRPAFTSSRPVRISLRDLNTLAVLPAWTRPAPCTNDEIHYAGSGQGRGAVESERTNSTDCRGLYGIRERAAFSQNCSRPSTARP